MLDEIINNPNLDKYLTTIETGRTIFLDLYILVSGELDILKGNKKISEVTETGSFFGEMSFLLGTRRTATVKASNDVTAIAIPKEEITTFLSEFPNVASEMTKILAKRLDETSQELYGLKEFCDQIPDSVILTDRDGNIFSWNASAEKLYGRDWRQMRNKSAEGLYEDPQVIKDLLDEVREKHSIREKVLKIKHPEKGIRYISTSINVLYDIHHNIQGVLSLGRDVTEVQNLERKYRRTRCWLIPSLIFLALLSAAIFFGYPYFSRGYLTMDAKKLELKNQLAKDYLLLKSLLSEYFAETNRSKAGEVLKDVFDLQATGAIPYTGVVLLDQDKKVFCAYSIKMGTEAVKMAGSSYADIEFEGSENSLHRVLTPYRTAKDHPMGYKGIELAFEMKKENQLVGWLIFQMDVDLLKKVYDLDEVSLKKFEFKAPG